MRAQVPVQIGKALRPRIDANETSEDRCILLLQIDALEIFAASMEDRLFNDRQHATFAFGGTLLSACTLADQLMEVGECQGMG